MKNPNLISKTGGEIRLEVRPEDIERRAYQGRDAITIIEGEKRQFEKG